MGGSSWEASDEHVQVIGAKGEPAEQRDEGVYSFFCVISTRDCMMRIPTCFAWTSGPLEAFLRPMGRILRLPMPLASGRRFRPSLPRNMQTCTWVCSPGTNFAASRLLAPHLSPLGLLSGAIHEVDSANSDMVDDDGYGQPFGEMEQAVDFELHAPSFHAIL